jgi:hypothetical protein
MKSWMVPWLFPLGLLATVAGVSVFKTDAQLVMLAGGLLLATLLGSIVYRPRDGEDPDVDYWRIGRRQ